LTPWLTHLAVRVRWERIEWESGRRGKVATRRQFTRGENEERDCGRSTVLQTSTRVLLTFSSGERAVQAVDDFLIFSSTFASTSSPLPLPPPLARCYLLCVTALLTSIAQQLYPPSSTGSPSLSSFQLPHREDLPRQAEKHMGETRSDDAEQAQLSNSLRRFPASSLVLEQAALPSFLSPLCSLPRLSSASTHQPVSPPLWSHDDGNERLHP
jgi:hypothetical protein